MSKTIIIIGAGLSGLSAGITLQKKGYMTQIFERAPWVGGACAAWVKEGYVFDSGMHYMLGTKKEDPLYGMYLSVNAINEDTKIFNLKEMVIEIGPSSYTIPLNVHALSVSLIQQFPIDERWIKTWMSHLAMASEMTLFVGKPKLSEYQSYLRYKTLIGHLHRELGTQSVLEYISPVKNPSLKAILHTLLNPHDTILSGLLAFSQFLRHNRGIPEGGSKCVVARMEAAYRELGGRIHLNAPVSEILVKDNKVAGVKVGTMTFEATHVISSIDASQTVNELLQADSIDTALATKNTPHLLSPFVIVSLGLNKRFSLPYYAFLNSRKGVFSGFETTQDYLLRSYDYEKTYQKPNHQVITVFLKTDFDPWVAIKHLDSEAYKQLKQRVASSLIEELDARFAGLKDAIDVLDVATPATYERLFHYDHLTLRDYGLRYYPNLQKLYSHVPKVKHLYLVGQSVTNHGGIALVIKSGIDAAKAIK